MALVKLLKINPVSGKPRQHDSTADELNMLTLQGGNIKLAGNSVTSEDVNGNIILDPNGTGVVNINNAYDLPTADGSADQVLSTNGAGVVSFVTPFAAVVKKTMTAEVSLNIRDIVYISSADNVSPADANAESTARVIGFAEAAASPAATVSVVTQGALGGFSGLTVGARYFLSETAGGITATPPSTDESCIVQVGYAISTTMLCIQIIPIAEIDTD